MGGERSSPPLPRTYENPRNENTRNFSRTKYLKVRKSCTTKVKFIIDGQTILFSMFLKPSQSLLLLLLINVLCMRALFIRFDRKEYYLSVPFEEPLQAQISIQIGDYLAGGYANDISFPVEQKVYIYIYMYIGETMKLSKRLSATFLGLIDLPADVEHTTTY